MSECPQHILQYPCLLVKTGDLKGSFLAFLLIKDQVVLRIDIEVYIVFTDDSGMFLQFTLGHYLDAQVDVLHGSRVLLADDSSIPEDVHLFEALVLFFKTSAELQLASCCVPCHELGTLSEQVKVLFASCLIEYWLRLMMDTSQ